MNRLSRSMSWNETTGSDTRGSLEMSDVSQDCVGPWVRSPRSFFLPLHYEANYRYPLIVWLHSDGFNENQINQVIPHVSLRNYVAVGVRGSRAIDATAHRFEWSTSPASIGIAHDAVIHAIEEATERFSIHPDRIVLAGYHSGGEMALRLAIREPQRFAAVVSLGGELPSGGATISNLHALRQRRLPMLWQWATESARFKPESLDRDIKAAMMMRATVDVRQYIDDDEMTNLCLADLNDWVMRRVVAGETSGELHSWASTPTSFSSN